MFRCNHDGTQLELVATGLRNPQSLLFTENGDLFTGDNDCDHGDEERLVHIVEGGDSGWRVGYQYPPLGRGSPWLADKLWHPRHEGQAAYIIPPICNIEDGPSGIAYYPGTGLNSSYAGTIFITHFRGSLVKSGIFTYKVKPRGATYSIADSKPFLTNALPTDVKFGPDGRLNYADWGDGWDKFHRGRIYAIADSKHVNDALVKETRALIAADPTKKNATELARLLGHPDWRVRLEAQYTLAERGDASVSTFAQVATQSDSPDLAAEALAAALPGFLDRNTPEVVQTAALAAVHSLEMKGAAGALVAVVADDAQPAAARAAALDALDQLKDSRVADSVKRAERSQAPALRPAALPIAARLSPTAAAPTLARFATEGNVAEQKAALTALGTLTHPIADAVLAAQLRRLAAGEVAPAVQLELLDAAALRSDPAIKKLLVERSAAATAATDPLAPFRVALEGGDRQRGQKLFTGHPVLACVRCHRNGTEAGGDAGPNLAGVGGKYSREYLLESVVKLQRHGQAARLGKLRGWPEENHGARGGEEGDDLPRDAEQQGQPQGLHGGHHPVGRGTRETRRLRTLQAPLRHLSHANHGGRRHRHHQGEPSALRAPPHRRRARPS